MIEPIMFLGLGFLAASLLALVTVPLVHARAVRLTKRRVEASTPVSINEIQADKDQLRAEFAISTRRLEMSVEQLRGKTTAQLADLGKKTEAINNLKAELAEKSATISSLEASGEALRGELQTLQAQFDAKAAKLAETESKLADRDAALAKATLDLEDRSAAADSQRVELIALQTQVATLKDRVASLEHEIKEATETLARERGEKALVDSQLERARDDRNKMQQELVTLKRETEATWANERAESAILRERINDVAAEVAQLTTTLEGPGSPIETILAADAIGKPTNGRGAHPIAMMASKASLADRIRALQNRSRASVSS